MRSCATPAALLLALWAPGAIAEGHLRGTVRDPARLPLPAATVVAVRSEAPPVIGLTSADGRGMVGLDGLPPGSYRVLASIEGYHGDPLDGLEIGGPFRAVADVVLERGFAPRTPLVLPAGEGPPVLVLEVGDADGRPLGGVRLRLDPVGHAANPVTGTTDGEGRLRVEAGSTGSWRLKIERAGWARLAVPELEWPGGELTIRARLRPQPERAEVPLEDLIPPARFIAPAGEPPVPGGTEAGEPGAAAAGSGAD